MRELIRGGNFSRSSPIVLRDPVLARLLDYVYLGWVHGPSRERAAGFPIWASTTVPNSEAGAAVFADWTVRSGIGT